MFYKLKHNLDGSYMINSDFGRLRYNRIGAFSNEEVDSIFDFAYRMTFGGEGEHRGRRTGGTANRTNGQKFANTFQGKLGELAVNKELSRLGLNPSQPDYTVGGLGFWDHFDMIVNNRQVSIKSIKYFSQLLLLETGDWDESGRYLHGMNANRNIIPVQYDFVFLSRINPSSEDTLSHHHLLYSDRVNRNDLSDIILSNEWGYDIPGFITCDELIYVIQHRHIIPAHSMFSPNGRRYTEIEAENYYVRAADMHSLNEITALLPA